MAKLVEVTTTAAPAAVEPTGSDEEYEYADVQYCLRGPFGARLGTHEGEEGEASVGLLAPRVRFDGVGAAVGDEEDRRNIFDNDLNSKNPLTLEDERVAFTEQFAADVSAMFPKYRVRVEDVEFKGYGKSYLVVRCRVGAPGGCHLPRLRQLAEEGLQVAGGHIVEGSALVRPSPLGAPD